MDKTPQELDDLINDPKLLKNVRQQPGSERFQATVLGLAALKYLREQSTSDQGSERNPKEAPENP